MKVEVGKFYFVPITNQIVYCFAITDSQEFGVPYDPHYQYALAVKLDAINTAREMGDFQTAFYTQRVLRTSHIQYEPEDTHRWHEVDLPHIARETIACAMRMEIPAPYRPVTFFKAVEMLVTHLTSNKTN